MVGVGACRACTRTCTSDVYTHAMLGCVCRFQRYPLGRRGSPGPAGGQEYETGYPVPSGGQETPGGSVGGSARPRMRGHNRGALGSFPSVP